MCVSFVHWISYYHDDYTTVWPLFSDCSFIIVVLYVFKATLVLLVFLLKKKKFFSKLVKYSHFILIRYWGFTVHLYFLSNLRYLDSLFYHSLRWNFFFCFLFFTFSLFSLMFFPFFILFIFCSLYIFLNSYYFRFSILFYLKFSVWNEIFACLSCSIQKKSWPFIKMRTNKHTHTHTHTTHTHTHTHTHSYIYIYIYIYMNVHGSLINPIK